MLLALDEGDPAFGDLEFVERQRDVPQFLPRTHVVFGDDIRVIGENIEEIGARRILPPPPCSCSNAAHL